MERRRFNVADNNYTCTVVISYHVALFQKTIVHTDDLPIENGTQPAHVSIVRCEPLERFHDAGSLPCSPVCKITGTEGNCFGDRFSFLTSLKRADILYRGRKLSQACPGWLCELAAEHGSQIISRRPVVLIEHGINDIAQSRNKLIIRIKRHGVEVEPKATAMRSSTDIGSIPSIAPRLMEWGLAKKKLRPEGRCGVSFPYL